MRSWIKLVEAHTSPPAMLYHGTNLESLIGILMQGRIIHRKGIDRGHNGVSFTTDIDVAKGASHPDWHDGNGILYDEILPDDVTRLAGVIIYCKSADLGRVEYYDDSHGDDLEAEWRTFGDVPASAISTIALDKREVEKYREDYLRAQQEYDRVDHAHMADAWHEAVDDWLGNPEVLKTIDAILAYPTVAWPR
jgi:hypothetical protein